jgi:hypothetical protein
MRDSAVQPAARARLAPAAAICSASRRPSRSTTAWNASISRVPSHSRFRRSSLKNGGVHRVTTEARARGTSRAPASIAAPAASEPS